MKIVIEVSSGVVQAVYSEGPIPAALDVIIVDLDSGYDGSAVTGESFQIEPLSDAPEETREALK
jgi:hypothetical protein